MDFLKQIHVEFNGLGQPRSSKETAPFGEVSEFSWVSRTSNHILNMPSIGIHSHTPFLNSMNNRQNKAVPKVTSFWRRDAKNVKAMEARQRNRLATAPFGFSKHFKD